MDDNSLIDLAVEVYRDSKKNILWVIALISVGIWVEVTQLFE